MNVKKNPVYYVNVGIFLVLAVYSLLVCINVFDLENIDMNAGLCAVIAAMVVSLLMYLVHATRLAIVLYSSPLVKITFEIISVLTFLTLACVIRIYCVGEFEIYVVREGIVLACMFMAYLVARMLNQFGFVTLLILTPWPYMINTYNLELSNLIVMAEIMAGMLIITFILYMVRQNKNFKIALISVFVVAVVGVLAYAINSQGYQRVLVEDYKQYLQLFNEVFVFTGVEKYYYIVVIMAAFIGAVRMWLGKGSGNTLVMFAASAVFVVMTAYGLGGHYMHIMYLLLAIIASGACGTRPGYMDEEVKLNDNMDNVPVKRKKNESVEYVDDSDLDKMLDELESNKPYGTGGGAFNPIKFAAESEKEDEEIPIELQMYDFGTGDVVQNPVEVVQEKKEEPVKEEPVKEEKVAKEPVKEEQLDEEAAKEEPVKEAVVEETEVEEAVVEETEVEEDIIEETIEEVEMSEAEVMLDDAIMEDISDDEVLDMIVDEVEISEVEISEVEVSKETVVEATGSLTESDEFEMPVFEMDTSVELEEVSVAEKEEVIVETPVMVSEEIGVDDSVSLVVTDENAEIISAMEEFSMPTFEMDTVAFDNVKEMFEEEAVEEVTETTEVDEEVVEEVSGELFVSSEDAGSISNVEEFSMPTFEMSSFVETAEVLDEIVKTDAVEESVEEETVEETVEEEPVVLVQNPVFIRNPINFNRTRGYETQSTENKDYGFIQSAPTFETMGSFLADNKENIFPQFETTQSAMDDFVSSFVTEEEIQEESADAETEVVVAQEKEPVEEFDNFTSITIDVNDEEDFDEVNNDSETETSAIFEYATEETGFVDNIEMPDFMGDLDSGDLFGTFSMDSEDDDDFEQSSTEEIIVEPESIDLGLDLGEEFSFGQAQSLTDLYDYNSVPQTFSFEDVVEEEETEEEEEVIEEAEITTQTDESVNIVEDETLVESNDEVYTYDYDIESEEEVAEVVVSAKDDDLYDWDAAEVKFDEDESADIVEQANVVKAADSDFFDWNSVDAYDYEDEEDNVVTEAEEEKPEAGNNSFEEFVWTDDMINEFDSEKVEDIKEASEEIAVSMEYDYSDVPIAESMDAVPDADEETPQYEVFQSTGNFVPEVEEVVEETQYEVFQSSGNFVPEVEEVVEEAQYEVFQSSGNFVPEVEEVVEETQYEVFQSSGNFVPEVEEVVEETQYEVFQSSGNFEPEVEEVEEVTMYKTYGEEDEEEDKATSVKKDDDLGGFSMDFPDFDLDLPDF